MFPLGSEYPLFLRRWLLVGLHVLVIEVGYSPYATDRRMAVLRLENGSIESLCPYYFLVPF